MKVFTAIQFTTMALAALAMAVNASPVPKSDVTHQFQDSYVQADQGTPANVIKRNNVVLTGVSSQDYIASHNQPSVESSSVPDLVLG
ncbi:hypothetical protein BG006_008531 [Podila minutissima]|uniref:Uncharacterized protein n=1 Tax=Podila minutissima TaxID=64525 RepID=A0A9P5SG01_9FUNG|nr:hypothetical protein BG006_008531 [Podila minutissima]